MEKQKLDEAFVNDKDASELLGVSIDTLRSLRFTNRGPVFYKVGRSVRYSVNDLKKFLKESRHQTSEQQ